MKIIPLFYFILLSLFACGQQKATTQSKNSTKIPKTTMTTDTKFETATLGAGCFWCVEAVFQRLEGVEKVVSGYSGGFVENPTYRAVCDGTTGHAEVCQVTFDPKKLSFQDLLEVFFATHDPTTPNQQGNDKGTQYRSSIFYRSPEQKATAEKVIKVLNEQKAFPNPIVTEVTDFNNFYGAEDYHQNYYNQNSSEGYCRVIIAPKVEKLKKIFKEKLKK